MSMTLDSTVNRLAIAAMALLGLLLLAGCSDLAEAQASAAESEQREMVLSVPDMSCPMCPITVRRAINAVDGVHEAEADLETKQARVVFDPARTDPEALITAIESAGFSAALKDVADE